MNSKLHNKILNVKSRIPNWIDTKDVFHYKIWNTLLTVNDYIYFDLLVRTILEEDELIFIVNTIDEVLRPVLDKNYDLEIMVYYECLVEFMIKNLVEYEEYEAAQNIKRFYELYFLDDEEDLGYD